MEDADKFRKIFSHPDKDEVIAMLLSGDSVRQVEGWLKKKYPSSRKNKISFVTLQKFRSEYLDLRADVLKDLKEERSALRVQRREDFKVEQVKESDAYREGLQKYVQESLIDYNSEIKFLLDKCYAGIERLEDLDDLKGSHLNHAAIAGYLDKLKGIYELHYKMVTEQEKKASDQVVEDYEVLSKRVNILKEVIVEVFQETAPELQPIFVTKVRERMEREGIYD